MELLLMLCIPLVGSIVFAFCGHRSFAPELNSVVSFITFLLALVLAADIITNGPILVWDENFFVDSFNVFLVTLTTLVGFSTSLFSRSYTRIELNNRKLSPKRSRLYHSMYQAFIFTMLLALLTNRPFSW